MAEDLSVDRVHVDFARAVRAAGVAVGTGDVLTYCSAVSVLDPSDLVDVYWAGRGTLVTRRDQIPTYDAVFRRFFLDEPEDDDDTGTPFTLAVREEARATLNVPMSEPGGERSDREEETRLGYVASSASPLRSKAFAACTPEELAALRHIMRSMQVVPPRRRTRRTVPAKAGRRHDVRRTVRETMRTHGEPAELFWRRRRLRARPLILILDVSGSMADYSRNLLQFAYSTRRAVSRVEVFCFGTRLTRITRELEHRRPDEALDRAARAVFDWEGGTRIGDSLDRFVRDWARRGIGRGGVVVICSDGLDRGDPQVLATAMEQLSRLSHRVVWMNPHKGNVRGYQPNTLGMMAAAPYVDVVLSGHDLASLEELAAVLPGLG